MKLNVTDILNVICCLKPKSRVFEGLYIMELVLFRKSIKRFVAQMSNNKNNF